MRISQRLLPAGPKTKWLKMIVLLLIVVLGIACQGTSAPTESGEPSSEIWGEAGATLANDDGSGEGTDSSSDFTSLQPPMSDPFAPPPEGSPTLIFYNGDVVTMDSTIPEAQAVAVLDEQIQAVGTNDNILALAGNETLTIDLQGRALLPGFVDPHTHIFNDAPGIGTDIAGAQQIALENGVTTLANLYSLPEFVAEMIEFDRSGALQTRTSLYLSAVDGCGEPTGDWWREYSRTDEPGERLRIGGVKLFTDGGSCGCPAFSYDHPFCGYGDLWYTQEELDAMVAEFDAAGYQLAIHGLGDRALEQILNSFKALLGGEPNTLRHRIEHNATLRPDMLSRHSEIGVVPLIFGSYPACDLLIDPPPEAYQSWEWPWRAFLDANPDLIIAWHSDGPFVTPNSPLQNLYALTTPFEVDHDGTTVCNTPEWMGDQKTITVEEALPMMTINAAYTLFREDEVGSITPGKFADLIVLSANPLAIEPEQIINVQVWMTMISGETLHCAPGQEDVCP